MKKILIAAFTFCFLSTHAQKQLQATSVKERLAELQSVSWKMNWEENWISNPQETTFSSYQLASIVQKLLWKMEQRRAKGFR